jgi:tRNA threonylcarbamoyladenosine biosynthesis protein TsaB
MSGVRILAVETATDACSAALAVGNEVTERFEIAPRRHAALLLPFVESLLAEAGIAIGELDAIAFGRGPGSFTGLRIAAGMAQGLAFGADLPVVPVSTLAALAQGCVRECGAKGVLAALDARMHEVYFSAFRVTADGRVMAAGEEVVCAPASITVPEGGDWYTAGDGWQSYPEAMIAQLPRPPAGRHDSARPHAADVARLAVDLWREAGGVAAEQAAPVYLRNHVADKPGART